MTGRRTQATIRSMYQEISGEGRQQALEDRVLAGWKKHRVFARAQERRKGSPLFTFYEGPPTANGKPGIHHVLARTLKDVICRYRDLAGFAVERKAGWDTHGLPVEVEVEKRLGIHGKEAIQNFGVEAFTRRCIDSVFTYVSDWERLTDRIGFWLDLERAYVTYHESYVESVWWSLSELFKKGLLYKSHKVVWWWPKGGTALSSAEVGLGYRETADPSVIVRFPWKDSARFGKPAHFLAWTTTPWTLPSNVALALGADVTYAFCDIGNEVLVLAEDRRAEVLKAHPHEVVGRALGRELLGVIYRPLFEFAVPEGGPAYLTIEGDFVTTTTGTGIVHCAPAFGEDDHRIVKKLGLGFLQLVAPDGTMSAECGPFAGRYFKDADKEILKDLKARGLVLEHGQCRHEYPFCWRAPDDPLIQFARSSWFIRTTAVKEDLLRHNGTVNWKPEHIQEGRFGDFLRNNVDWALSRERFWGTPLPIWVNDVTGTVDCISSVQDILDRNPKAFEAFEEALARDPTLSPHLRVHKPWVDAITWSKSGEPGLYRRVPDVIDCWYDSGAMPFAQRHYPFENRALFESSFPADYICEGLDQTRGWFYSLLAISTLLFDKAPYRNVIVNGLVNDKLGRKMSKSLGNTVDPWSVITSYGADPLRWYLLASSPPWQAKSFDDAGVAEVERKIFGTLWPCFNFFAVYARVDEWTPDSAAPPVQKRLAMDRWLLSRTQSVIRDYRSAMDDFDPMRATRLLGSFLVDEVSNWYIRRNRARFWKSKDKDDKAAAYHTLFSTLDTIALLLAPIAPMSAEALHLGLHPNTQPGDSVHLGTLPLPDLKLIDEPLESRMGAILEVVSLARAARETAKIKIRQPLQKLVASAPDRNALAGLNDPELAREVKDEINVKDLVVADRSGEYCTVMLKPNLPVLGPRLGKRLSAVKQALSSVSEAQLVEYERSGSIQLELAGEKITVSGEDLLVERKGKEGFAVAAERGFLAALDTTLTPALIREGLAREVINRVQNQRKQQGLEVTTRIQLQVHGNGDLKEVVDAHGAHIAQEVLANQIRYVADRNELGSSSKEWDLEGVPVWISVIPEAG